MAAPFAVRLLAFYDRHRRDLPWRRSRDPWAVWVSEIMLQQTRVAAVEKVYSHFMERYPRPRDFAAADDDELLSAWRGLGYYRRARLLRDGAREVAARHRGEVPSDLDSLAALPGIGDYTQGALGSIAFCHPVVAIDGNVERVLARHRGIQAGVKSGAGKKAVRAAATAYLDPDRPGDFNQALMELGATVCTPRAPRCDGCPVAVDCLAAAQGLVAQLPVLPERRSTVQVLARAVLVRGKGDRVLASRVELGEINSEQVDLPGAGPLVSTPDGLGLEVALRGKFGVRIRVGKEIGRIRHSITHHRIVLVAHEGICLGCIRPPLLFAVPGDPKIPWTTTARKVFKLAGFAREK